MWATPLLRNLDRDLNRARQYLILPEGTPREDIALRREDVERMQKLYLSNKYAAELFDPYLQELQAGEKNAPKKARDHTPLLPNPCAASDVIIRRRTPASSVPFDSSHPFDSSDAPLEELVAIASANDVPPARSVVLDIPDPSSVLPSPLVEPVVIEKAGHEQFVLPASLCESKLLEQLLRYYKQKGVVGEEKNLLLQTLCVTNGLHFCLSGPSGSGKTKIIDALVHLLDPADVYRLEFASETALMNDVDKINATKVLYIPEVQKAYASGQQKTPMIAEIMKGITEGRDVTRRVTIRQGEVREYTLKSGLTVITSLAFENIFRYDEETARRLIALVTDTSEKHKEDVRQAKAAEAFYSGGNTVDSQLEKELRDYAHYLLHHSPALRIVDPFAQDVASYIPLTQRSASFQSQYYGLVGAAARFNHNRRYIPQLQHDSQKSDSSPEKTVFVSIEDHQLIYDLYHSQMLENMELLDKTEKDKEQIGNVRRKIEEHAGLPWENMIASAQQRMTEFYPAHAAAWSVQEQKIQRMQ